MSCFLSFVRYDVNPLLKQEAFTCIYIHIVKVSGILEQGVGHSTFRMFPHGLGSRDPISQLPLCFSREARRPKHVRHGHRSSQPRLFFKRSLIFQNLVYAVSFYLPSSYHLKTQLFNLLGVTWAICLQKMRTSPGLGVLRGKFLTKVFSAFPRDVASFPLLLPFACGLFRSAGPGVACWNSRKPATVKIRIPGESWSRTMRTLSFFRGR